MSQPAAKPAISRTDPIAPLLPSDTFRARDGATLIFVMSRARKLKSLCSLLAVLALAGLAGYLARWRKSRTSPLALAQAAHGQWIARPDDAWAARNCYRCVARLVGWFDSLPLARRTEACREEGLAVETDTMEETGMCRFTVADKVPAHRLMRCHTRADIGVPVVAWRPNDGSGQWDGLRPPEGIAAPATAILDRGSKGQWTLRFLSPYRCETVTVEERTYPLAASFTAPIAKLVRQAGPLRRSGFRGMLNSSGVSCREKLYLMQPYDPDRIPLLMVHGLQSTAVSFSNLVNDLFADPMLHARYQIWLYHYPTGIPVLQNAAVLRRILKQTLREIDPPGTDFATNQLVVLGHSMGGIMTHTLLSDSGYTLWDRVISVRPERFSRSSKTRSVVDNQAGEPYTHADFERRQAELRGPNPHHYRYQEIRLGVANDLAYRILAASRLKGKDAVDGFMKRLEDFFSKELREHVRLEDTVFGERRRANEAAQKTGRMIALRLLDPFGVEPFKRGRERLGRAIAAFTAGQARQEARHAQRVKSEK